MTEPQAEIAQIEYGVVLDECGSADMYDTREEAESMNALCDGLGVIRVTTEWLTTPPGVVE